MKLSFLRSRWATHLGCVVLGAAVAGAAWAASTAWGEADLAGRMCRLWDSVEPADGRTHIMEFRSDNTFSSWARPKEGEPQLIAHGHWDINGRHVNLRYAASPGRVQAERYLVARADGGLMVLLSAAGDKRSYRPHSSREAEKP